MEKLDKVIAGLGACVMGLCQSCPYGEYGTPRCRTEVMVDAHNLTQRLRDENERLKRKLKYARAERDAATARISRLIGQAEAKWLEQEVADD